MIREPIERPTGDPLAAHLLPVLMHRMNNATQLLSNLHAIQQHASERDWIRERADDLAQTSADIERLGYLLAVLASASGADLLLERRERRGLQILADAVTDAIRRSGGEVRPSNRPLPDQSPAVHDGWELPWGFGALLYHAARTSGKQEPFEWQLLQEANSWVLVSSWVPSDTFEALQPLLRERLPETQLDVCTQGWSWRLPLSWLVSDSAEN